MENFIVFAIPALFLFLVVRCLLYPMQWVFKVGIHVLCGFACLWLLNTVSGFTGVSLPVNGATAWIAGVFGVPGISLIALLEMI